MWTFKGYYTGEARTYIKNYKKKWFIVSALVCSILCLLVFIGMAIELGNGNLTLITIILQKELLIEGAWEDLKLLLKKVEESLGTDTPMYQIEEPTTEFFDAIVKSKRIFKSFVGVKMVHSAFEYFATFALENGQEVEYEIGQELYEKIEQGEAGTLVLINGNFFSFGEGEDIE